MKTVTHGDYTPAWRRILSPMRYLAIRHPGKVSFDLYWPLFLTALSVIIMTALPVRPAILGDKGFLHGMQNLIGLLAAFFVAALAAVSTVERKSLDARMLGKPPELNLKPLSRRTFVCMLFGYLSVLSFTLYLGSIAAEILAPSLRLLLSPETLDVIRVVLGSVYALGFWNMATTTSLGIWFLVERIPMQIGETDAAKTIAALVIEPVAGNPVKSSQADPQQN